MTRIVPSMFALLLASACDTQDAAATAAKATAPKTDGAPTGAATPANEPAKATPTFASLSDCLKSCENADVIPTNRETCRLNCDAAYGAQQGTGTGPAIADAIGKAASCFGSCYSGDGAPDACLSECRTAVAGAASPPAADVLDRLGGCVSTCHADKSVIATNRKTCELNCAQSARVTSTPVPSATPGSSP